MVQMDNYARYEQHKTLVSNTLLHLYITMNSNTGFTPQRRRQEIITKYLKARVTKPQFSLVKKDFKKLLSDARVKHLDLEQKLWELNRSCVNTSKKIAAQTDVHKFGRLMDHLYSEHGYQSRMEGAESGQEKDVLYMCRASFDNGFDEDNNQVQPIHLYIDSSLDVRNAILNAIESHNTFHAQWVNGNEPNHTLELTVI